ncbi:MAG: DUF6597 domain-containing transcriptional factor, partial [Acidobacteriota bacterium]
MLYREVQPRPELATFVECLWTLEDDGALEPGRPEPILPDGCSELILNFGARFNEQLEDGRREAQPLHFLVGQMTRPILIAPTGRVRLVGIRFQPGGAFPFFRLPMNELADTIVELSAVDATLERELIAVAADKPLLQHKLLAIEDFLARRTRHFRNESWLPRLAAAVIRTGGRQSVDELATAVGVTGRQLQRRFLREVGIGPKLLCRILRFQQVFRAIELNQDGWAPIAADCGYYDQAHLIRDFQQFARQTPAVLLAHTT